MKQQKLYILKDMFFIIVISSAIGAGINLIHPRGFVFVSKSDFHATRLVPISADEAKIKYDSQAAVFIDARELAEYEASRISGAIHIPASSPVFPRQGADASYLNGQLEIVVYCDGPTCGASDIVARKILKLTSRHVYLLEKGFPEWVNRGYPVQRGK
jgi:rhodanese-related sulfurtransferase